MNSSLVHPVDEDLPEPLEEMGNHKSVTTAMNLYKVVEKVKSMDGDTSSSGEVKNGKCYTVLTYTIPPGTELIKRWDYLMVVLLTFTALVTPFEVCFLKTSLNVLFIVNRLVDLLFFGDMILNFLLVYYSEEHGRWVKTRREIANHYMRSWFFIDMISLFPIDVMSMNTTATSSTENLRLLKIVRLLRLIKLLRILRSSRIFRRIQRQLGLSFASAALIKFISVVIMIVHWLACVWNLAEGLVEDSFSTNWKKDSKYFNDSIHDSFTTYLACIEVSIMFMVMSYGRFSPANPFESGVAILSMCFAGSVYAYVIGSICSVVSMRDPATQEYQQTMDLLNSYMNEVRLPKELKEDLRTYFTHCKQLFRTRYYNSLLKGMSPTLRGKVSNFLHSVWVERIPFFNAESPDERYRFIIAVATKLIPAAYAPNELVFRAGDLADCMYIVQKGLAAGGGRVFSKGKFFGEDMILKLNRRKFEVRILTYVDLYTLSEDDLYEILGQGQFHRTEVLIKRAAIKIRFSNKIKEISNLHKMITLYTPKCKGAEFLEEKNKLLKQAKLMKKESIKKLTSHFHLHDEKKISKLLDKHGFHAYKKILENEKNEETKSNAVKYYMHRSEGSLKPINVSPSKANKVSSNCVEEFSSQPNISDRLDRLEDKLENLIGLVEREFAALRGGRRGSVDAKHQLEPLNHFHSKQV